MEEAEPSDDVQQRQNENTAALVMNTFYRVAGDGSATAEDITNYLLDRFGDVWQVSTLKTKTEEALKRNAAEGLLEQQGDRFIASLVRESNRRKRARRCCGRVRKRRRRSCRPKSRKKPCCCNKNNPAST